MESENIPEWKLKTCCQCSKEYVKGTGITKIELLDEDKIIDYPDWKYIGFEGPSEYEGKFISLTILCFCSKKCCEEYFSMENNK
ncbi:hypothetical protein KAT24_00740 [Candidatus Pacearchaeota archaeon]|nr:hypothetical protein [Candidatus Pacearchaeota archaeon]